MLDPKEEARFAELKSMCRELHVPAPPEIMIGLKVHDQNGVLTFDDVQRGHSWTRNFWNYYCQYIGWANNTSASVGAGYLNIKAVSGSVYDPVAEGLVNPWALVAGVISSADYGILMGTGDTAYSANQYALIAQIAQGAGAGQFSYQAESTPSASYNAGAKTWTITRVRIVNNNSGGSITVKEVGLAMKQYGLTRYTLTERSVLSPTVAVANGAQLTVTYAISMDFSAID